MSGVRIVQGPDTSNTQQTIIANSATIGFMDPVTLDLATGFLRRSAATEQIEGYFVGALTTASATNQTVELVRGSWEPNIDQVVFEVTANQAALQVDLKGYAPFVVTAGNFTITLPATAVGEAKIIDFDPNRDGTTTLVRCQFSRPQKLKNS